MLHNTRYVATFYVDNDVEEEIGMHSNAFSSRRIIQRAEKRKRVNICKTAQLIVHKIFQLSRIARLAHLGPIPDLSRGYYAHCCIWYSCIVRSTGRLQREISVPIDGRALARWDRDRLMLIARF